MGYAKCPGKRGETCVPKTFFCDREPDCEPINGTAFDESNCSKYSEIINIYTHNNFHFVQLMILSPSVQHPLQQNLLQHFRPSHIQLGIL